MRSVNGTAHLYNDVVFNIVDYLRWRHIDFLVIRPVTLIAFVFPGTADLLHAAHGNQYTGNGILQISDLVHKDYILHVEGTWAIQIHCK